MAISLRLNNEDTILIKNYAKLHDISVSDLFRQAVMEKIEDEYDLNAYEKAMEDYNKDGTTYSLSEVEKELGLS
ncbi:MAG: CopG family transcriptional regulator [Lachnospiraceae bacterium]|nr:CopG family transcriptional regulator [Lachnospiraceae bacterium]